MSRSVVYRIWSLPVAELPGHVMGHGDVEAGPAAAGRLFGQAGLARADADQKAGARTAREPGRDRGSRDTRSQDAPRRSGSDLDRPWRRCDT